MTCDISYLLDNKFPLQYRMWKLEEQENSKKSREGTRKYTKVNKRQGQNDSEGKFKITSESPLQTLDRKGFHKLSNKN